LVEDNVVKEKSFKFALRIVRLYRYLQEEKKEYVLSKQVLKSGTAIGAMIRESQYAQSKADFIHKLSIALKEANETDYWIELLFQSGYLEEKSYLSIHTDIEELLKLLTSIVKTTKSNK
jgi:four helix bundle protein